MCYGSPDLGTGARSTVEPWIRGAAHRIEFVRPKPANPRKESVGPASLRSLCNDRPETLAVPFWLHRVPGGAFRSESGSIEARPPGRAPQWVRVGALFSKSIRYRVSGLSSRIQPKPGFSSPSDKARHDSEAIINTMDLRYYRRIIYSFGLGIKPQC